MQNHDKDKRGFEIKNLTILFPIAFLYIIGFLNVIKERRSNSTYLESIGPYIGYACIAVASVIFMVFLYRLFTKLSNKNN